MAKLASPDSPLVHGVGDAAFAVRWGTRGGGAQGIFKAPFGTLDISSSTLGRTPVIMVKGTRSPG